ncbi:MAG: alpha/beta fold hydrolase, partial [Candidatus Omnitrophota bacterium]
MLNTDRESGVMFRKWAASASRAVFLLVHGLGAHSGRWEAWGEFFLSRNITSFAIELKGFGETREEPGHIDSFSVYLRDIRSLCGMIGREFPGKKIFIAGESMGALIAFEAAVADPGVFSGLVCLSIPLKSRLKISFLKYAAIYLSLVLNPRKQFTMPFDAAMCTRDPGYRKILDADAREHRLATARFLWEIRNSQKRIRSFRDTVSIPSLFLFAGRDQFVDTQVNNDFYRALRAPDKTVIEYPDMYHALSIDLGRERVFADVEAWMDRRE